MRNEVEDFARDVLEKSRTIPILVDFWAPWCGPCRILGPVLERLAERAKGRWELVKVNTEEAPELAREFEVYSIPDVRLFVGGKPVDGFVGVLPESEIEKWLEKAIPISRSARYEKAARFFAEGHCKEAAELLAQERAEGVRDPEASLLYARSTVCSDPKRALEALGSEVVAQDPPLAEAIQELGNALLSPVKPDGEIDSRLSRYFQGLEALRNGRVEDAMELWIGLLEEERGFLGGKLVRICRALFQVLGWHHPLTDRYSRRFSAAVHV
ncbi:thioredoxin domain-containing protein [Methylacidimicrobium cyclopophantes]|nr:thioredoxin domain-containing protein [Methylacidimicrobium cyclopophantes]